LESRTQTLLKASQLDLRILAKLEEPLLTAVNMLEDQEVQLALLEEA
jgi:hypothetical protein